MATVPSIQTSTFSRRRCQLRLLFGHSSTVADKGNRRLARPYDGLHCFLAHTKPPDWTGLTLGRSVGQSGVCSLSSSLVITYIIIIVIIIVICFVFIAIISAAAVVTMTGSGFIMRSN